MATTRKTATTASRAGKPNPDKGDPDVQLITEHTMRHMHGLLRVHGYTDRDDVHDLLTVMLGRQIGSRRDLTEDEAQIVCSTLEEQPRALTPEAQARLRAPFPAEAIGKLPRSTCKDCSDKRVGGPGTCDRHPNKSRCNECHQYHSSATMHIDFVGHADVTDRLLSVDPWWTWEPYGTDPHTGLPALDRDGNLWIRLTICGVTRPGVGDAENGRGAKELIGDALRNASMRFGVALNLWAKGDREWAHTEQHDVNPGMSPEANVPAYHGPSAVQHLTHLSQLAAGQGTDLEGITAKFRSENGGLHVDALSDVAPERLAVLVERVERYIAKHPAQESV